MNKMKILKTLDPVCLFCGKEKEKKWINNDYYFECNCEDTMKTRHIEEQISKLKQQLPKHKYDFVNVRAIQKIKNIDNGRTY